MDQSPPTRQRIVSRILIATATLLVVAVLGVLIVEIRTARHRTALLARLMRFEDASVSVSYQPYKYSAPLQIGGLYERGGLRMHPMSVSGKQPFWAELVEKIFEDHRFAEIYEVTVNNPNFSDADVPLLNEFSGLRELSLSLTRVTDNGIGLLAHNDKLTKIELVGTPITDAGLVILDSLLDLRELDVARTNVTKGGVEKFRKRHPDCLVFD